MRYHLKLACAAGLLLAGVSAAPAQLVIQPRLPGPQYVDDTAVARQISDWYVKYLRRHPDDRGLHGWIAEYHRRGPAKVLAGILGSPEYYTLWGSSDVSFVEGLHSDLLGVRPSNWEMRHWLNELAWHRDRARLAQDFIRSNRLM
jgi:Domain of unknown function (DUF4214)